MTIEELMDRAHATAIAKGWWGEDPRIPGTRNFPEQIALMHSELSEALEEFRRHGLSQEGIHRLGQASRTPTGWAHKPEGLAAEFADVLIRIANTCKRYSIPLAEALEATMAFNETRPHRHGGKLC